MKLRTFPSRASASVHRTAVRGRFAPSPTGWLHLGNARTALLAWLQVRVARGAFLLRIEDLDAARCRPAYRDGLLRDLDWLGLSWDGAPILQSERKAHYEAAFERLLAEDRAYPCFCSRKEIASASAPHGPEDDGPRYPGTCAELDSARRAERARTRAPVLRFRVREGEVGFVDRLVGPVSQDVAATVGDFVIRGRDGVPSYQLAVVVDDAENEITDVVRGEDLVGSTPRQLLLYEALGEAAPRFWHVPLLLGEDGRRLAKREGPATVRALREAGSTPEAVIGELAFGCGLGDGRPYSAEALAATWSPEGFKDALAAFSRGERSPTGGVR